MKNFFKLCIVASIATLITSCVGQKDVPTEESYFVKLATNSKQVDIDKAEKIVFSVTADGKDVTQKASIVNISDGQYVVLKDKDGKLVYEFTPLKPASHTFIALYNNNSSETIQVRAISPSSQDDNKFYRRSCVMKYTATTCTYCPDMGKAIKAASEERAGRLIEISVHSGDQLSNIATATLAKYAAATSLPEVMIDYRNQAMISSRTVKAILNGVDNSTSENPTFSGLKMTTKLENNKIVVDMEARVLRAGKYKIAVAILMDGFAYDQTGSTDPNYRQNSVLRDFLCVDPFGDDLGEMIVGEKKAKTYSYDLLSGYDITRYSVVAMIFNQIPSGDYRVNNIIKAGIGETLDYEYEQKEI